MTEKEVLAVLGEPDDVRTKYDPNGYYPGSPHVWGYGTDGHLTFPTLGCVFFCEGGTVRNVYGGQGTPPFRRLFQEEELRGLLRLIDKAPRVWGSSFNPRTIIQIVNRLQPLGKEKALAAIDEYLRVAPRWESWPAREGLFLVLRVLFDVPEDPGYMPWMHLGLPNLQRPFDPKRLPHFPLVLLDDIPLLLIRGYELAGSPEPVEVHVDYFRKHGQIRAKPLRPSDAPLSVFRVFQTGLLRDLELQAHDLEWMVMNQFLWLMESVYRKDPDPHGSKLEFDNLAEQWQAVIDAVAKRDICWDEQKVHYTFKDGSFLPERPKKYYRRVIWQLGVEDWSVVIIERHDERCLLVHFSWLGIEPPGTQPEPRTVRVYALNERQKPLAEFQITGQALFRGITTGQSPVVKLQEGESVQMELSFGKETKVSPVYVP